MIVLLFILLEYFHALSFDVKTTGWGGTDDTIILWTRGAACDEWIRNDLDFFWYDDFEVGDSDRYSVSGDRSCSEDTFVYFCLEGDDGWYGSIGWNNKPWTPRFGLDDSECVKYYEATNTVVKIDTSTNKGPWSTNKFDVKTTGWGGTDDDIILWTRDMQCNGWVANNLDQLLYDDFEIGDSDTYSIPRAHRECSQDDYILFCLYGTDGWMGQVGWNDQPWSQTFGLDDSQCVEYYEDGTIVKL